MSAQFLLAIIFGSFLLAAIEARPKPDTVEIVDNGPNTEIIDFKPNGSEDVIDINQNPWGGSQTSVREISPNNNYNGYNGGNFGNNGGNFGNSFGKK